LHVLLVSWQHHTVSHLPSPSLLLSFLSSNLSCLVLIILINLSWSCTVRPPLFHHVI
jgi:hypothetical protein